MQTFLPSIDYFESGTILDNKRLNKQILEGYQILNVLSGQSLTGAWRNHPAVLMWKNAEMGLWNYIQSMVSIAKDRGIKTDKNEENLNRLYDNVGDSWSTDNPFWHDKIHISRIVATHRANLYIKDPFYYARFKNEINSEHNVPCCTTCKYYWASHTLRDGYIDINV